MWYRIILITGLAAFICSLLTLQRSIRFVDQSNEAIGVVVKFDTLSGGDVGTSYSPVFRIMTSDHQQIIYSQNSSSSTPGWKMGKKALFLYDRQDPKSVKMYNYFGLFSWSIVLMALAILLITFGGGYFCLRRHWHF